MIETKIVAILEKRYLYITYIINSWGVPLKHNIFTIYVYI